MIKRLGVGLVNSEMVSAMGLTLGQEKTLSYLMTHPKEKPLSVQIFGSEPAVMARAAQTVEEMGADMVDINMGCPVKKVIKTGAGASLLRDPKRVAHIVTAVRLACKGPLTVKIRVGWAPNQPDACDIAKVVEDCGADALTVHGRFAVHGYAEPADWTWIRKVKALVKIPVIGNGDVFQPVHALQMREHTGCDAVMIGRGAVGNPWIFRQILCMEQGLPIRKPKLSERRSHILEHFRLLIDHVGEQRASLSMRGLLLWYTKGLPHSSRFRGSINKIRDLDSLLHVMDSYFSKLESVQENQVCLGTG
jgi:nifR3 family TIM-barrel protein